MQRVYVDGKPISPAGLHGERARSSATRRRGCSSSTRSASGAGADIIATDTSGGSLRRLTQHEGANTYAACSPDGRLVVVLLDGQERARDAGLFIMPIQRPWLAKKISSEVGDSLRWEPLATK